MDQESIMNSPEMNHENNSATFFSIGDLLIKTFSVFQPQYEQKRIRLTIELDSNCPSFWLGDSYTVQNILNTFLSASLSLINSGAIHLKIWFEDSLLNIAVDAPKNHEATFSAILKINPRITETELTENLLTQWQLKNIEFSDLILEFIKTFPIRVNQIDSFVQEGLYTELKAAIHAFKGVSLGFHLCELYTPLAEMERSLKSSQKIDAEFIIAYNALLETYKRVLKESTIHFPMDAAK